MKYRHINIGKPARDWTLKQDWSFVRGTSVEKAIEFILNGELLRTHPGIIDDTTFHVHGTLDFPKTYDFSKKFKAPNRDYIFLPAKAYAENHAFHDYLANKFNHIYESNALPDNNYFYEHIKFSDYKFHPEQFYEEYLDELKHEEFGLEEVKNSFNFASRHKGVLIYFNDNLLKNNIYPDSKDKLNKLYNSVKVQSTHPIKLECITAIHPLSDVDKYELNLFLKYMKEDKEKEYISTLFR